LTETVRDAGKATPPAFPATVRVFVAGLSVASILLIGLTRIVLGPPGHLPWAMAGALLVLMTAAVSMVLRFQFRDQIMALDLFEAMLAPAIFALPPLAVIALAGVATAIAQIHLKANPVKGLFNVAQWTFAAGVSVLIFHGLPHGTALTWSSAGALVLALTVGALCNTAALTIVISLAQGRPARDVVKEMVPTLLLGWAVNTSFGLLFVASYRSNPLVIALFVVPLLVLRWSHRSYAAVLADKARLAGMHRATRALVGPINPRDALTNFVTEVRKCFDAGTAELVVRDGANLTVYSSDADGVSVRVDPAGGETLAWALGLRARTSRITRATAAPALVGLLNAEGRRDCIAAPLFAGGSVAGVLCAYDCSGPEGFEEGELAVLETLAREAAGALAKAVLMDEILEERKKLTDIVGHTSDGIVTLSPEGTAQLWNRGMEVITGYTAEEMLGEHCFDRLRARDEAGVDVIAARWASGVDFPSQLQIITKEGQTRWLAVAPSPVNDGEGRPHLLVLVVRDVTRAHEVERLKDDFVATVSHELRTPLTPIKGFAMTLVEAGDALSPQDRTTAAQSILRQAEHLERLVVNLLDAAKLERGGASEDRDAIVDVNAVAERIASDFRASHADRIIVLDSSDDCRARGDELFISQIISNLVSNAIKYAPAEEPIEIRCSHDENGVVVSVTDRGPGIPTSELERIFDRFHRLGNVLTRAAGGTGLGLYIARQLASAVGGTISVESTLGEGSTFILRLRPPARLVAVS
jgi:PAS domain S-box-containing protein